MNEITKEEQRDVQLGLMSYIDRVCREHGIEYSISAGTLLGSVKYKGYIPWDDDIDMMLTRPNYERLMEVLMGDLPEHFILLYYKSHTAYLPFAKLYDNRTYFISELDTLNKGTGLFVDIFPLDSLPENKVKGEQFKKKVRTAVTKLVSSAPNGLSYASSEKRLYFLVKSLLWLPYHLRYKGRSRVLAEKVDILMQKYNDEEHKFCNFVWSPPKRTGYFDKGIFTEYEDIDFEHLKLRKIKNHDVYLSELYGDWRNPPKKRAVRNHSYYRWYWKEKND